MALKRKKQHINYSIILIIKMKHLAFWANLESNIDIRDKQDYLIIQMLFYGDLSLGDPTNTNIITSTNEYNCLTFLIGYFIFIFALFYLG